MLPPAVMLVTAGVVAACGRGEARPTSAARGEVAESTFAWPLPDPERAVVVEVRNGAGVQGLARLVTRRLRAGGADVVAFGSHDAAAETTLVLVRRGSDDAGKRVRDLLGQGLVRVARDSTRRVDVSVILGADYRP